MKGIWGSTCRDTAVGILSWVLLSSLSGKQEAGGIMLSGVHRKQKVSETNTHSNLEEEGTPDGWTSHNPFGELITTLADWLRSGCLM